MIAQPEPYDLTPYDHLLVRGLMNCGFSLKHIAGVLNLTVHELDVALWNSLGRQR